LQGTLTANFRLSTTALLLLGATLAWGVAVTLLAASGALSQLVGPQYALLVAAGIIIPTLLYALVPAVRRVIGSVGLYWLTLIHVWRVPAALAFFWYGAQGQLPPGFWIPAAVGDFLVGLYAMRLIWREGDTAYYQRFHLFGFADFVLAVGLGLAHTLIGDSRMAPVALLPLALIPLFGVGLSGASHLVSFHLLWTGRANRPAR
jgi:hypothetical protein